MTAHAELDGIKTTPQEALRLPRVPEPADENDILREQLEYLIRHAAERSLCSCSECQRYLRVRALLLEIFSEPEPQPAQQAAALPIAA